MKLKGADSMWVAGIDEAGRGCICGALFVAGVIGREENIAHFGAKDSKKLSPKQRERIYQTLLESQHKGEIGLFVAQIEAWEIDKLGLSIAMKNGIEQILCGIAEFAISQKLIGQNVRQNIAGENLLKQDVEQNPTDSTDSKNALQEITIDGNTTFHAQIPHILTQSGVRVQTMIKADDVLPIVSCASIVAKVSKDRQMHELDKLYPQYFLAKNKGYGTLQHKKAIAKNGYCPYHRKSFKILIQECLF
ncbi:ribonuclease HII [uncultured Helicobacter sp.]|uniref:ribonuclease HII n=1 Tax=uncultured Helicobacter sp. TaxID=175537 RepID=UPI0025DEF469|nr:ribonuclease HII [uncultured Helicobacter sp.]